MVVGSRVADGEQGHPDMDDSCEYNEQKVAASR
jgi:hypothetical protein